MTSETSMNNHDSERVGVGVAAPTATAMTRWEVHAEGVVVGHGFEDREDAEGFAAVWNDAYPPDEGYAEFVVVEAGV